MKARVARSADKKLLCCGLSRERLQIVGKCAADHGADIVEAGDGSLTIGQQLGGIKGEGAAPAEECLIFSGFDRAELNALLESLRTSGVRIPLKAVVTAHNIGWKLDDLIAELRKEHEYMNGGGAR